MSVDIYVLTVASPVVGGQIANLVRIILGHAEGSQTALHALLHKTLVSELKFSQMSPGYACNKKPPILKWAGEWRKAGCWLCVPSHYPPTIFMSDRARQVVWGHRLALPLFLPSMIFFLVWTANIVQGLTAAIIPESAGVARRGMGAIIFADCDGAR